MATKSQDKEKLQKIENQLSVCLTSDRRNWAEMYKLMRLVRNQKLYNVKYASFTQWVNALATSNRYHVSTLWQRFSAGEVYSAYTVRQQQEGNPDIKKIEDLDISPESLALIGTITKRAKDPKYADKLVNKAINHEMSRQDLREVNRAIKNKAAKKVTPADPDLNQIKTKESTITAKEIVDAFQTQKAWLNATHYHRRKDYYYIYPELPIRSGTTVHARRMDVCVLENLTADHATSDHLNIHTIEIKVSKLDLIRDKKMAEYYNYGNYFWLAIPSELLEVAKKYVAQGWGILTYKDGKLEVARKAEKHACVLANRTLSQIITHSISSL